jgi:hypothetical protein
MRRWKRNTEKGLDIIRDIGVRKCPEAKLVDGGWGVVGYLCQAELRDG